MVQFAISVLRAGAWLVLIGGMAYILVVLITGISIGGAPVLGAASLFAILTLFGTVLTWAILTVLAHIAANVRLG